jgi:hypothetical protein
MDIKTITIENIDRSPRQTDNFDDEEVYLHNEHITDDEFVKPMQPIDIKRQDIIWSWQDTTYDFIERYNKIVQEMSVTLKDIHDTMKYTAELKLPFCWEYARLAYTRSFNELLAEFGVVDHHISSFVDEMEAHKTLAIERADENLSESSINYLDNIIGYYADRSTSIKEDLEILKKHGMNVVNASQQMSPNCGYVDF